MSSQWTSKYTIMRDLSLAQGCEVPADLQGIVAANDKPPILYFEEETEEEYFQHSVGDGDCNNEPDFSLIQQMLEMIRDSNVSPHSVENVDTQIQITKPIPVNKECNKGGDAIKPAATISCKGNVKKTKKKRENVAVNSILQAQASDTTLPNGETTPKNAPLKLLKPTDFISTDKEVVESVEKVNGWLDSQKANFSQSNKFLDWEPSSMFKRKSGSLSKSAKSDSINSSPAPALPQKASTTAFYQPSTLADEYYQKFMERSKLKDSVQDDIWTRAEKVMKEIDAKKHLETEEMSKLQQESPTEDTPNYDVIRLPQHRHLLTGECIVCEVIEKSGIKIDVEILNSATTETFPLAATKPKKS